MLKGDYVVGIREAFKKKGKIYLIFEYFPKNLLNIIESYSDGLAVLIDLTLAITDKTRNSQDREVPKILPQQEHNPPRHKALKHPPELKQLNLKTM